MDQFISVSDSFPHIENGEIVAFRPHLKRLFELSGNFKREQKVSFPHSFCGMNFVKNHYFPPLAERYYTGNSLEFSFPAPLIKSFGVTFWNEKVIICDANQLKIIGVSELKDFTGYFQIFGRAEKLVFCDGNLAIFDGENVVEFGKFGKFLLCYQQYIIFDNNKVLDLDNLVVAVLNIDLQTLINIVIVQDRIYAQNEVFRDIFDYFLVVHRIDFHSLKFLEIQSLKTIKVEAASETEGWQCCLECQKVHNQTPLLIEEKSAVLTSSIVSENIKFVEINRNKKPSRKGWFCRCF